MITSLREKLSEFRSSPNMPVELLEETRDRFCPSCITRQFQQKRVNGAFLRRLPRRVRQAYVFRCEKEGVAVWKPDACILCTPRGNES